MVRSFDSEQDAANISPFSNFTQPKCCFDPDTLPVIGVEKNVLGKLEFSMHFDPNPFRTYTRISVQGIALKRGLHNPIRFEIFDIRGQKVADFTNELLKQKNQIIWNGSRLSSGIFLARLRVKDKVVTKALALLK